MTERSVPAIGTGETLVHIGAFGTGAAVVQGALHQARDRLATQGVLYPGRGRQPYRAVSAILGRCAPPGRERFRPEEWHALAGQVASASDRRVVLSSEYLSDADEGTIPRLVEDLGGSVRVVVTLRPLASILPSSWQYVVGNGVRARYPVWLRRTLDRAEDEPASTFWRRHRHDRLVRRWAKVVGERNLTVVVLDDSDRGMLTRTFEALIGLPAGFLRPALRVEDRALTYGETELVRKLNNEFRTLGLADTVDGRDLRRAVLHQMRARRPRDADTDIVTPDWALDRCAELGAEMAADIACSEVRLVGDIAALGRQQPEPEVEQPRTISVELASAAVLGSVRAAKPEWSGAESAGRPAATDSETRPRSAERGRVERGRLEHGRVADVRAWDLLGVLADRVRRRMRRSFRRLV